MIVVGREAGGGLSPFVWGLVVGAGLALLFAPQTGAATRAALKRKWDDLKDLAEEKVDEVREQLAGAPEDRKGRTREELERRLAQARAARRGRSAASPPARPDEDDEPVA